MFCLPLHEATSVDRAGGKAANLAKVQALGLRVPRTIVVDRHALRSFLDANALAGRLTEYFESFGIEKSAGLTERHQALDQALREGTMPAGLRRELLESIEALLASSRFGLAVRSSAVFEDSAKASFAGVFESFLGLAGPEEVLDRIVCCWASLWSPKALRYLSRMGLEPSADGMAVILQEVVPATASGVVYTADPLSGDPWRFVLNATHGVSVDLMSGSGAGDRFSLDWSSGAVTEREVAVKTVLMEPTPAGVVTRELAEGEARRAAVSDAEAAAIAELARRLDDAFATRLDIEWALTPDGPWIVQARPLTALPEFFPVELTDDQRRKSWVPATFTLPLRADHPQQHFLTPLYRDLSESEHWFRYQPRDVVLTGVWREDLDLYGYRYAAATPFQNFLEFFDDPADYEPWLDENEPRYRPRWDDREAEVRALAESARAAMAGTTTAAELVAALLDVRDRLWDLASFGWSGPQALGWMCETLLRHFLHEIDAELDSEPIVGGGTDSYTFAVTSALQELGRSIREPPVRRAFEERSLADVVPYLLEHHAECEFLASYEALCWRYGKTPPSWYARPAFWSYGESDAPRMHTVRCALYGTSRDVREVRREAQEKRQRAEDAVRARITEIAPDLLGRFDKILAWTRCWTRALNDRHGLGVGLFWEREVIWEAGGRLQREGLLRSPEDVLVLRREDLEALAAREDVRPFGDVLAERKSEYERNRRLRPPAVIGKPLEAPDPAPVGSDPPEPAGTSDGTTLEGTGFAAGEASGRARRVTDLDPGLLDALTEDDVLVLPHDDAFAYADWHSLLMVVKAVVSPGRPAHHLSQVARECGVPVVGHVKGPLERLEDGAELHVDGRSGVVRVL